MTKEEFAKIEKFGIGAPNDTFAKYFIGQSFLKPLTDFQHGEVQIFNVTFEPGSVIVIPVNVKHWHGTKKDSWFSHITFEPVKLSDEIGVRKAAEQLGVIYSTIVDWRQL